MKEMKTSKVGIDLIKDFEGFRSEAYLCPAGVLTIGYGHIANVKEGDTISKAEGNKLLKEDLKWAEEAVNKSVKVEISQGMFDALVSFTFNLGAANFKRSTLLKKINKSNYNGAVGEFSRWVFVNGVRSNGIARRRRAEAKLFKSKI